MPAVATGVPSTRFTTDAVEVEHQFDAWRQSIGVIFDVEPPGVRVEQGFFGQVQAWHLGDIVASATAFTSQSYLRSGRRFSQDGLDHYLLQLYTAGGFVGDADGAEMKVQAGSVCVLDLARPCHTRTLDSATVTLVLPREVVEEVAPGRDLHGAVLGGGRGVLLADFLASLARRLPEMSASDAPLVTLLTREMVRACLPGSERRDEPARRDAVLLVRAKRYIEHELTNRDLTPDRICGALGVSRHQLYRAFETLGGVASFVRNRRLRKMHALLSDPAETRRIADLAYEHGFESEAHFSRAFRGRYGYPPREARLMGQPGPGPADRPGGYEDWVRALQP